VSPATAGGPRGPETDPRVGGATTGRRVKAGRVEVVSGHPLAATAVAAVAAAATGAVPDQGEGRAVAEADGRRQLPAELSRTG
jgi:hypothetical protein